MPTLTELRGQLQAAVEPLLTEGEEVTVAAGESQYEGGLDRLGFTVSVAVPNDPERVDELLEPASGVKQALEAAGATVRKSSGHQPFPENRLGATWQAEILT